MRLLNKFFKWNVLFLTTLLGGGFFLALVMIVILIGIMSSAAASNEYMNKSNGFEGGNISEIGEKEIPEEYIPIYQSAEKKYGVMWNLLAAIHRVETRFSTIDPMISSVGAEGHMQVRP